jgi:hypothetical protein
LQSTTFFFWFGNENQLIVKTQNICLANKRKVKLSSFLGGIILWNFSSVKGESKKTHKFDVLVTGISKNAIICRYISGGVLSFSLYFDKTKTIQLSVQNENN